MNVLCRIQACNTSKIINYCLWVSIIKRKRLRLYTECFFLQKDKTIRKLIFAFSKKTLLVILTLYLGQFFTYTLSILTTINFTVVQIFLNKTAVLRLKLKLWMKQADCKLLTFENLKSCFHCTSEQWEIIGVNPIMQTCPGKQTLSHEQLKFSSHTGQVTPTKIQN